MGLFKGYASLVTAAIRRMKRPVPGSGSSSHQMPQDILSAIKGKLVSEEAKNGLVILEDEIKLWERAGLDTFFDRYKGIMEALRALEAQGIQTAELTDALVKHKEELKIALLQRSYRELEAQLARLKGEKRRIGRINEYMELVDRYADEYDSSGTESYQMLKNRLHYLRSQLYCARGCKYS